MSKFLLPNLSDNTTGLFGALICKGRAANCPRFVASQERTKLGELTGFENALGQITYREGLPEGCKLKSIT